MCLTLLYVILYRCFSAWFNTDAK